MNKKLYLTFDLDWVDDFILEETVKILEEYNLKATFFTTHKSKLLNEIDKENYEISLHPNFIDDQNYISFNHLYNLKDLYPYTKGVRSHSLFFYSKMLEELENLKIRYESNIFLYKHLNLSITKRTKHIYSAPFNWSDDKNLELDKNFDIDKCFSFIKNEGLNILNFHPIHIYLNSNNIQRYQNSKKYFNNLNIRNYKYEGKGIRTLFCDLCKFIKKNDIQTFKLDSLI